MSDLLSLIERFYHLRILVIGEAILDRYLYGCATRFCQETPTPVVTLSSQRNQPGGAANTAVNAQSLGAQVTLCSVIGDDEEGRILQKTLAAQSVNTRQLFVAKGRSTLTKQRILDGDRLLLRFDQGNTDAIAPSIEQKLIHFLMHRMSDYDAIIISDYSYGILTNRVIRAIASLNANRSHTIVIDAKNLALYKSVHATAIKPNYQQATQLLEAIEDQTISRADWIASQAETIFSRTGAEMVAVTLDQDGAILLQKQQAPHRIDATPACPTRTIGAGDTFTATFAIALAAGASPILAAELASTAAAIGVSKPGTTTCTASELIAHYRHELESRQKSPLHSP